MDVYERLIWVLFWLMGGVLVFLVGIELVNEFFPYQGSGINLGVVAMYSLIIVHVASLPLPFVSDRPIVVLAIGRRGKSLECLALVFAAPCIPILLGRDDGYAIICLIAITVYFHSLRKLLLDPPDFDFIDLLLQISLQAALYFAYSFGDAIAKILVAGVSGLVICQRYWFYSLHPTVVDSDDYVAAPTSTRRGDALV